MELLNIHFKEQYKVLTRKVIFVLIIFQSLGMLGSFLIFSKVCGSTAHLIFNLTRDQSEHDLKQKLPDLVGNVFDLHGIAFINGKNSKSSFGQVSFDSDGRIKTPFFSFNIIIESNDRNQKILFSYSVYKLFLQVFFVSIISLLVLFVFYHTYKLISKDMYQNVLDPLDKLNRGIQDFTKKNKTRFLKIKTPIKEINEIKDSFSHLILQLNFSKMQLAHANKDLESKIAFKTKELALALEQMKKYQKQIVAQEKLASLGGLSSGIAHELRNPLNLILNSSNLLKDEVEFLFKANQNPRELSIIKFCGIIEKNCLRADKVIEAMSFHSSVNRTVEGSFDLSQLCLETIKLLVHTFQNLNKNFKVTIEDEIEQGVFFFGHIDELRKCIFNIVENSFLFFKEIQSEVPEFNAEFRVKLAKNGEDIELSFWDNGPGISVENIDKVKDPFFTTRQAGAGTGLGLTLVNDIVTSLSGELNIHSVQGKFTLVQILVKQSFSDKRRK